MAVGDAVWHTERERENIYSDVVLWATACL